MVKEIVQLQLSQFARLLATKRVSFSDAHYVIFSDYPTESFLMSLIENCDFDKELLKRLCVELQKIWDKE